MKHAARTLFLAAALMVTGGLLSAATIVVPTDQPTIRAAVDSAAFGDTIMLEPGFYTGEGNRGIMLNGKQLQLIGIAGADSTTIDVADSTLSAFVLNSNDSVQSRFTGFTIANAAYGFEIDNAFPELDHVRLSGNRVGLRFHSTNNDTTRLLTITAAEFNSNDTGLFLFASSSAEGPIAAVTESGFQANGHGLFYYSSEPEADRHIDIANCTFLSNETAVSSYDFVYPGEMRFDSCMFDSNTTAIVNSITLSNSTVRNGEYAIRGFISSRDLVTNTLFEQHTVAVLFTNVWEFPARRQIEPSFDPGYYLADCIIRDNPGKIASLGGFINEDPVGATFENCSMTGNGGGITGVEGLHRVVLSGCLYANNARGIEMRASGYGLEIYDCTFANNDSTAVYSWSADWSVTIERSIFYQNGGYGIELANIDGDSALTISCNDLYGNSAGDYGGIGSQEGLNGNFSSDPLFCNSDSGQFTLFSNSQCAPANSPCSVQVGAFGTGCAIPVVDSITIDSLTSNLHVIANEPIIFWNRIDSLAGIQTAVELAVGSDTEWTVAELWEPGIIALSDTFIAYSGDSLIDGATYHLRLRVYNDTVWTDWKEILFHMNVAPTLPFALSPIQTAVATASPTLWLMNGIDEDSDLLQYDFAVYADSELTSLVAESVAVSEQFDSTGWVVSPDLVENQHYWWQGRVTDGHEPSDWTAAAPFWVNSIAEIPFSPTTIFPPGPFGLPLFDLTPTFTWMAVTDPDPYDTIHYSFEIGLDSTFAVSTVIDSLQMPSYDWPDSLTFGTRYWWRACAYDQHGFPSQPISGTSFWTWLLGDINHSHTLNILDVNSLVSYLFAGGPVPNPVFVADMDGNCRANILDVNRIVSFLFASGSPVLPGCE